MRLRGPHLIGQANLNTSVSSQSGTLEGNGIVILLINAYAFFPANEVEVPGTINRYAPMIAVLPLAPDADAPDFLFFNVNIDPQLYAAEWRHISP